MYIFLLFFVGIPLLELYLLIQVGSEIGALPTIGLTILTALVGGLLVRRQGFAVLNRIRESSDRGEVPALEILDGALLLIAGLVLLLPGFFTDAIGFLLLVPAVRQLVIRRFVQILPQRPSHEREAGPDGRFRHRVIEADYHRDDR